MIIGLLFRCDFPNAPDFRQEISIIAILRPTMKFQKIFVYNTHEFITDSFSAADLFIKNAQVRVTGGGQVIDFRYFFNESSSLSMYIDFVDKLIVKPGDRYEISIKTTNGILTGHTTVPHSVDIITPLPGDSLINNSNVNILWEADEFAYGYIINLLDPPVKIQFNENSFYTYRNTHCFYTTDTSFVIPGNYIIFSEESSQGEYTEIDLRYTLKLMAIDENFKNHLFNGYDISGIKGGYGLFGSATVDSVDFFVIE